MAGRGAQSFQKRQKEQQRKEKQQEKMAKRVERKRQSLLPPSEGEPLVPLDGVEGAGAEPGEAAAEGGIDIARLR